MLSSQIHAIPINNFLPIGYEWRCVHDPEGLFFNRIFRLSDIEPVSYDETLEYKTGTEFQHLYSSEYRFVLGKRVIKGFRMVGNCRVGWSLYNNWTSVYKAETERGVNPDRSKAQKKALADYRQHLASCPECLAAIKEFISIAENGGF